jgi:hypothetical protein
MLKIVAVTVVVKLFKTTLEPLFVLEIELELVLPFRLRLELLGLMLKLGVEGILLVLLTLEI